MLLRYLCEPTQRNASVHFKFPTPESRPVGLNSTNPWWKSHDARNLQLGQKGNTL